MDSRAFLQKIGEITENNDEELTLEMLLEDVEGWNSLAVVTFMAMSDSEFGVSVNARDMRRAKTLRDLYDIVADRGRK